MNIGEYSYLNELQRVLDHGEERYDRTGVGTLAIFHSHMEFDLRAGFPLLSTKRMARKSIIAELLWFLSGSTNARELQAQNVHIWDGNSSREFLDSRGLDYPEGEIGPGYGHQWRRFGAEYPLSEDDASSPRGVDQISNVIDSLRRDPHSRRHIVSAWNPADLHKMSLPPCFPPDTLTLTNVGYLPIQEISKEHKLLSHNGEWREITEIFETPYTGKLYSIKTEYHPYPVKCTPNHPFYYLTDKGYEPKWVAAEELTIGGYIGLPINTKSEIKTFTWQQLHGSSKTYLQKSLTLDNPEYWFIMGYYMGDGWLDWGNNGKYRFYFVFNHDGMEKVYPIISRHIKLHEVKTRTTGCRKFEGRKIDWHLILKSFGHKAHNKKIPEWVQDAPNEFVEEFIKGYVASDGHTRPNGSIQITTTSPHIAFGIQRLCAKLGKISCNRFQKKPKTHVIEGRIVNQRDLYHIAINTHQGFKHHSFIDNGYLWFKIQDVTIEEVIDISVYNFSVKDDHSYVVENLTTHNCHLLFQFFLGKDGLQCMMYQRSADMFLGVPFNIASYALLTHMVAQQVGVPAHKLHIVLGDAHIYKNHLEQCKEQLSRKPLGFPTLVLTERDSIFDYRLEDIEFEKYKHHPFIRGKMAI